MSHRTLRYFPSRGSIRNAIYKLVANPPTDFIFPGHTIKAAALREFIANKLLFLQHAGSIRESKWIGTIARIRSNYTLSQVNPCIKYIGKFMRLGWGRWYLAQPQQLVLEFSDNMGTTIYWGRHVELYYIFTNKGNNRATLITTPFSTDFRTFRLFFPQNGSFHVLCLFLNLSGTLRARKGPFSIRKYLPRIIPRTLRVDGMAIGGRFAKINSKEYDFWSNTENGPFRIILFVHKMS